jgi:uncharacterized protein
MRAVFADTYYFCALANQQDESHDRAMRFSHSFKGQLITSEWVLTELADAYSKKYWRPHFLITLQLLKNDPRATIVEASHNLFERAVRLFATRPDKDWSLTDCTSFLVMEDLQVGEALTADHHFSQAGFVPLLG